MPPSKGKKGVKTAGKIRGREAYQEKVRRRLEVLDMRRMGVPVKTIALRLGLTPARVSQIALRIPKYIEKKEKDK